MGKKDKQIVENLDLYGQNQKNCAALAIGCGVFIGAALMWFIGAGGSGQLFRMYACVAATLLTVLTLYCSFRRLGDANPSFYTACFSKRAVAVYAFVAMAVLLYTTAVWLIPEYSNKSRIGEQIAFFFLILMLALLLIEGKQDTAFGGKPLFVLTCVFSYVVMFLYGYAPNILNQSGYVVHHYTAATDTIYRAAYDVPFAVSTSGVYGHYAIFLWPLLKLVGHTKIPQVTAVIIAVLCLGVLTLLIALILKMTKNNFLRSLSLLAAIFQFGSTLYAAGNPIRFLWPLLILTYVIYGYERIKSKSVFAIWGYVLCSMAITWQTDSGIAAAAAYTAFLWISLWKTESVFSAKALKVYGLSILGLAGSVFGMVVFVNLYNLLCGGPVVFLSCFYPLILGGGYVESLEAGLMVTGYSWLIPVCVFIVSTAVGLLSSSFLKVSDEPHKIDLAVCGIMGLGQSYYYFNHATAGWGCVIFYFMLCLAYLIEHGFAQRVKWDSAWSLLKHAVGVGCALYLCVFALDTVMDAPARFSAKLDTEINTMDSMDALSEAVKASVPQDTYAFGNYTREVYAYLDWDPGSLHDCVSDSLNYLEAVREEIRQQDAVLVTIGNDAEVTEALEDMVPVLSIPKESPVFRYYMNADKVKKTVLVQDSHFSLANAGEYQIAMFPMTIQKNTMYKVDLTLADNVDFSTAAGLVVDFYGGPTYDGPEQQAANFVGDGKYQYSFYFNSGEFYDGSDILNCYARIFVWNLDTVVQVERFSVSEIESFTR